MKYIWDKVKKFTTCDWVCVWFMGGLLISIAYLFFTRGNGWSNFLFWNRNDTGMDFFHSIEYVRGRVPYEKFQTLYPPLANLLFYVIFCFVPSWQHDSWPNSFIESVGTRGSVIDLRLWQPTMMIFVLFVMASAVAIYILIQRYIEKYKSSKLVSVGLMLSFGMINAYERGNIIIFVLLFILIFIEFKDSKNKIASELALISLAIAAGLKIYPAVFGILLIYDKQYKKAVRTIFYGIIAFVAPFFAFKEGLGGIFTFLKVFAAYSEVPSFSCQGLSADKLMNIIAYTINNIFGPIISESALMSIATVVNISTALFVLFAGFFVKKRWEKVLVCTMAVLIYQTQYVYILIMLIIPLLIILQDEERINKSNAMVIGGIMITQILLPLGFDYFAVYNQQYGRLQLGVFILLGYIILKTNQNITFYLREQNQKKGDEVNAIR